MPLVFVHGVANRMGDDYRKGVATRDALFRRFLLADHKPVGGQPVTISNPYWGDLGATLAWGGASMPIEEFEALGSDDAPFLALHAAAQPSGTLESADSAVLTVARDSSLPDAVDLLWASAALVEQDEAEQLAELADRAWSYATQNPRPGWLDDVRSDDALLTRLQREIDMHAAPSATAPGAGAEEEWETLGIGQGWNAVRRGLGRLRTAVVGVVGKEASDRIRPAAIPSLANFLGDVFVYLHQQRSKAPQIAALVEADLRAATAARTDDDPLVVVAHSMGGNIVYDILTSSARDIVVDCCITAGTQIGFFEELKLFQSSDPNIPGNNPAARVPLPANIRRWINVFDYSDLLGFEIGSVIDEVEDFAYRTGSLLRAHSQYFIQPGFHERLAARVRG